jgi:hypothetical protein
MGLRVGCYFSRNQQQLHGFGALGDALVKEVKAKTAIFDGKLVVADEFNGKDLQELPLLRRKKVLKRILPSHSSHVLYVALNTAI